ncbi:hypothetical protein [uncultured Agrococcus sp.]|uniref:hypothetical protein n=1 Tax=uncultured Agrococcus sp. TaxID=382258 RepID=UPI0025EA763E|nr:hypothetical protein [uncultured Agrococcus sp.]
MENRYKSLDAWHHVDNHLTEVLFEEDEAHLEATALQTGGVKGWNSLIVARRKQEAL